jgi:hypothetical protein
VGRRDSAALWFSGRNSILVYNRVEEVRTHFVERRDKVAAKMTPDQVAEAQKLARDWEPSNP